MKLDIEDHGRHECEFRAVCVHASTERLHQTSGTGAWSRGRSAPRNFEAVSLDSCPRYVAISYAWGEAVFSRRLEVHNARLNITPSLDGALRRLRKNFEPAILWADAVCINQADLEEMGYQITMMYSIYSYAQSVAVWLGAMTPDDADAFWIMHALEEMSCKVSQFVKSRHVASRALFEEAHTGSGRVTPPTCRCCGLGRQRSYIVQELVAGSARLKPTDYQQSNGSRPPFDTATTLYCGSYRIAYASLTNALFYETWLPSGARPTTWTSAQGHVYELAAIIQDLQDGQYGGRLLDTMMAVRDMACADPRDRVFAFRTMAEMGNVDSLYPAYDIPITMVWQRTAIYLLTERSAMRARSPAEVLALAAMREGVSAGSAEHSIPSWVPSFDQLSYDLRKKHVNYGMDPMPSAEGGRDPFVATYDIACAGILRLRG
ncbi:hypothetical protein B0A48_06487 [Cryoendolithus antarcticus]|uniref:Heterokaryon incompatibility domain-containing protein n=1 Tax=Cryoendolithus antarcticus TaxID=1507870 RepID=A0A1V8TB21_9PEZI|nr:hypothetical protein B0A48_06487 [Cryoendolithus antarcticus]